MCDIEKYKTIGAAGGRNHLVLEDEDNDVPSDSKMNDHSTSFFCHSLGLWAPYAPGPSPARKAPRRATALKLKWTDPFATCSNPNHIESVCEFGQCS